MWSEISATDYYHPLSQTDRQHLQNSDGASTVPHLPSNSTLPFYHYLAKFCLFSGGCMWSCCFHSDLVSVLWVLRASSVQACLFCFYKIMPRKPVFNLTTLQLIYMPMSEASGKFDLLLPSWVSMFFLSPLPNTKLAQNEPQPGSSAFLFHGCLTCHCKFKLCVRAGDLICWTSQSYNYQMIKSIGLQTMPTRGLMF